MEDSSLSLLPPIITILIAMWRKNALMALLSGVVLCFIMAANWQPITGVVNSFHSIVNVFLSIQNVYIISFSMIIGAFVALMNHCGAVNGFIAHLAKLNLVKNSRHAGMLPTVIGSSIFTDSNLSMFTAGMASQTLFDKHNFSRARLAYLLDSTCAPISILILINGWGAYVLGLLNGYNLADPVAVLMGTIVYNFYAIIAVMLAYYTAYTGKIYGPMKHSLTRSYNGDDQEIIKQAPARVMWIPLVSLLVIALTLLLVTGNGDMRRGNGAFSVFWSVIGSLTILILFIGHYRLMSFNTIITVAYNGIKKMLPVLGILVLSFSFGEAIKTLGTGIYISQLINVSLPLFLIAPAIFLIAALTAFTTGTSWATFAILIPIAVPVAMASALPVPFLVAAVLGGGIFGDHASPISDTTVVASIASGCDHFEHVKTQLPYALVGGIASLILYTLIGLTF
ncbi:MAG: sodium:proton antiporter [Colwellia sp.]|nr:sodium:proton antiporter [Colwellia sp.]